MLQNARQARDLALFNLATDSKLRGCRPCCPTGRLVSIGLEPHLYGTHSLRRTKTTLIYRRTGNLGAVQLLLGHSKIESTVRYLGMEVDDAIAIAEQVDV